MFTVCGLLAPHRSRPLNPRIRPKGAVAVAEGERVAAVYILNLRRTSGFL